MFIAALLTIENWEATQTSTIGDEVKHIVEYLVSWLLMITTGRAMIMGLTANIYEVLTLCEALVRKKSDLLT